MSTDKDLLLLAQALKNLTGIVLDVSTKEGEQELRKQARNIAEEPDSPLSLEISEFMKNHEKEIENVPNLKPTRLVHLKGVFVPDKLDYLQDGKSYDDAPSTGYKP